MEASAKVARGSGAGVASEGSAEMAMSSKVSPASLSLMNVLLWVGLWRKCSNRAKAPPSAHVCGFRPSKYRQYAREEHVELLRRTGSMNARLHSSSACAALFEQIQRKSRVRKNNPKISPRIRAGVTKKDQKAELKRTKRAGAMPKKTRLFFQTTGRHLPGARREITEVKTRKC